MSIRSRIVGVVLLAGVVALACLVFFARPAELHDASRAPERETSAVVTPLTIDTAETEREPDATARVASAGTRDTPSTDSLAHAATATLVVTLVRGDDGRRLAGHEVAVHAFRSAPSDEAYRDTLTTDEAGCASFTPPSDRELSVLVQERDDTQTGGPSALFGFASSSVEPLAAGEQRTLQLVVPIGEDLAFWGHVVAEDGDTPIAGARVTFRGGRATRRRVSLATGDDGFFDVRCSSWNRPDVVVTADGYATAELGLPEAHDSREHALRIPLKRAAKLLVHLLERGISSADGARVKLTTLRHYLRPDGEGVPSSSGYDDKVWMAECDTSRTCHFDDLPPRAPLSVAVLKSGEAEWKLATPLTLLPGEERELTLDPHAGTRLRVRLLDDAGVAVAKRELWLTRSELLSAPPSARCYFRSGDEGAVVARNTTDARGECVFDAVAAGGWWVGPRARTDREKPVKNDHCAVGTFVDVLAGTPSLDVELRAERGQMIRGRVVGPDGEPVESCAVYATHEHVSGMFWAPTIDSNGEFELGPLVEGAHQVVACAALELLDALPVTARPGGEPLVLRMRASARMRGVVFDLETGTPVESSVICAAAGAEFWAAWTGSEANGTFEQFPLAPDRYDLTAWTEDGRVGVLRGVEVGERASVQGLRIGVAPGGRLHVEYTGPATHAKLVLRHDGALVHSDLVRSGTRSTCTVPVGRVVVELTSNVAGSATPRQTKEVDLARGETKDIAFHFD